MKDSLKSKLVFALFAIGIPLMLLGQAVTIKKTSDYPNNPHPAAGDLFLVARTGVTNFNIRYDQLLSNVTAGGSNFFQTLYVSNAYISNLTVITNLNFDLSSTNAWFITNVQNISYVTNTEFVNNEYVTNLYVSNAYVTNITATTEIVTNLTVNNEYVTNLYATYVNPVTNFYFYSTNLYLTDNYVSNYFVTNVFSDTFVSNYLFTNVFITNQYTTNLYSTNVVVNNSYVSNFWQTNILVTDTYVSNFFTTNFFTTFVTNIYNTFNNINLTNATLYGQTLFAPIIGTQAGYVAVQNNGVDVLTLNGTNSTVTATNFVANAIIMNTNVWAGPTNYVNVLLQDQYYSTLTALSITGFFGAMVGKSHSVQVSIFNGSGSNVDMTLPAGVIQPEGASGAVTVTNGTERIFWFKLRAGRTNVVHRSF